MFWHVTLYKISSKNITRQSLEPIGHDRSVTGAYRQFNTQFSLFNLPVMLDKLLSKLFTVLKQTTDEFYFYEPRSCFQ